MTRSSLRRPERRPTGECFCFPVAVRRCDLSNFDRLFPYGRGTWLRVLGVVLALSLAGVLVWFISSLNFDVRHGDSNRWTSMSHLVLGMAVGIAGAIIGGIGRAQAGKLSGQ